MKRIWLAFLAVVLSSNSAIGAGAYITINDMSELKYQMLSDGRVYFRNLNAFDSSATGCCYAFYLDTTTGYGKSAWSTILMKIASKGRLILHVDEVSPPSQGNPVQIDQVGEW